MKTLLLVSGKVRRGGGPPKPPNPPTECKGWTVLNGRMVLVRFGKLGVPAGVVDIPVVVVVDITGVVELGGSIPPRMLSSSSDMLVLSTSDLTVGS